MVGDRLYLAPQDMAFSASERENAFRKNGLDGDELAALLGTTRALNRILIVDAADVGPAGAGEKKPASFALRAAVERWSRTQGVYAIAACVPAPSRTTGEGSPGLLAGLLVDSATNATAPVARSSSSRDSSGVLGVMDWFNTTAERASPMMERLGLDPQLLQHSTNAKALPLLAAAR
jgi:hypothetical protein